MKRHVLGPIPTLCVVLLIIAFDGKAIRAHHSTPTNKENCTYSITIETTCTLGASTSDQIHIRFGDTKSNDILIHHLNTRHVKQLDPLQPQRLNDDVPRVPFRACTIDQFQVVSACVESPVCYLYLMLSGNDDWRPGFAQVRVIEGPDLSSRYFYFRRYVPRAVWHGFDMCDDKVVTPFGVRHKKKVFHH